MLLYWLSHNNVHNGRRAEGQPWGCRNNAIQDMRNHSINWDTSGIGIIHHELEYNAAMCTAV